MARHNRDNPDSNQPPAAIATDKSKSRERHKKHGEKRDKENQHSKQQSSVPSAPQPAITLPASQPVAIPPAPTNLFSHDNDLVDPATEVSTLRKRKQTPDEPAQSCKKSRKTKCKPNPEDEKIQYLRRWTQAGRWFARHVDLWISPYDVIQHGMELASEEAGASQKKKKNDYNQLTEAWKLIADPNDPNFAVVCEYLVEDNISKLDLFAKIMKEGANQARSDDTGKLKKIVSHLLADKSSNIVQLYLRAELGWGNNVTGRHLCPTDRLTEYDEDPAKFCDGVKIQNTQYVLHPRDWGSFVYNLDKVDLYPTDSESVVKGAFKSAMMIKHIFDGSALRLENDLKAKGSVSKIHKMNKVIGRDLAYVAVQLCFIISSKSTWGETNAGFNLKAFYYSIVEFFERKRKGSKAILEYWTDDILQNIAINTGDADVNPNSRYALLMAESESESEEEGLQPAQCPAAPAPESGQPSATL